MIEYADSGTYLWPPTFTRLFSPRSVELNQRLLPISFLDEKYTYIVPTSEDMETLYEEIAARINQGPQVYDHLIAVLNGGLPGAESLVRTIDNLHLKSKKIMEIQLSRYPEGQAPKEEVEVVKRLTDKVFGETVLVVEDVVDHGPSLTAAIREVSSGMPKIIHTCAAFVKPWRNTTPTYFSQETDSWIIFPREPKEFVNKKRQEWLSKNVSPAEINRRFSVLRLDKHLA